jgi:hypothetical protein
MRRDLARLGEIGRDGARSCEMERAESNQHHSHAISCHQLPSLGHQAHAMSLHQVIASGNCNQVIAIM